MPVLRHSAAAGLAVAFIAFLATTLSVRADVIINIQRISDTEAIVTGSGSIDISMLPFADGHLISLENPSGLVRLAAQAESLFSILPRWW